MERTILNGSDSCIDNIKTIKATMYKVAIIIGGMSGIGLAVAKSLLEREWIVHIISRGTHNMVEGLHSARLHEADVICETALSQTFKEIFQSSKRLDFVFASVAMDGKAGVSDNLSAIVHTAVLALEYGRRNPDGQECSVILNTSNASFVSWTAPCFYIN